MFNTVLVILAILIPVLLLASAVWAFKKTLDGASPRKAIRVNAAAFLVLVLLAGFASVSVLAAPEEETAAETAVGEEAAATQNNDASKGLGLLAAGLVTGLAGIGGGIAVAAGAPAAIAATAEDPKAFGKSIIFVALGESIALYGVVIAILILQKV